MDLKSLYDIVPWEWPKNADKLILGVLRDDGADTSDRILAATLAGDSVIVNDELVDVLLSVLGNGAEADDLRGRAAISLGPALEYADTEWVEEADTFDDPSAVPISEKTFRKVQETLHNIYLDAATPKNVRRRVLEAAVRAPQDWHETAIREAYSSADPDWKLTAVFCMRFVRGFDDAILESLTSKNEDIRYEAVCAAGNFEVDAAWPHITKIITSKKADKRLLLAAIEATAGIRPDETLTVLYDLLNSEDEDIVDAVHEAMAMAGDDWAEGSDDDEDDEW
ncbi:MAG: HEAT repeat domain-containing protein [Desulfobacterales bacterium]